MEPISNICKGSTKKYITSHDIIIDDVPGVGVWRFSGKNGVKIWIMLVVHYALHDVIDIFKIEGFNKFVWRMSTEVWRRVYV